jgi:hypothetical protein
MVVLGIGVTSIPAALLACPPNVATKLATKGSSWSDVT